MTKLILVSQFLMLKSVFIFTQIIIFIALISHRRAANRFGQSHGASCCGASFHVAFCLLYNLCKSKQLNLLELSYILISFLLASSAFLYDTHQYINSQTLQ